jgi:predicted membrane channel-forming protein YqfA (hemolysin III family)
MSDDQMSDDNKKTWPPPPLHSYSPTKSLTKFSGLGRVSLVLSVGGCSLFWMKAIVKYGVFPWLDHAVYLYLGLSAIGFITGLLSSRNFFGKLSLAILPVSVVIFVIVAMIDDGR